MFDTIIGLVAPHRCYNCQEKGPLLCLRCEQNIINVSFLGCVRCGRLAKNGICSKCSSAAIKRATLIGEREGPLKSLIDGYKFERQHAASETCARLLAARLRHVPKDSLLVPIPTSSRHIRQRGYDHIALLTKKLAKLLTVEAAPLLHRNHQLLQLGATRQQRLQQAETAFSTRMQLDPARPYVIIDDIITTGATIHAAAKTLKAAGAQNIEVAVLARQRLDE